MSKSKMFNPDGFSGTIGTGNTNQTPDAINQMISDQPNPKVPPSLYQIIEDIENILGDNGGLIGEIAQSMERIGFFPSNETEEENKKANSLPYYEERLACIKQRLLNQQDFLHKMRSVLKNQIG